MTLLSKTKRQKHSWEDEGNVFIGVFCFISPFSKQYSAGRRCSRHRMLASSAHQDRICIRKTDMSVLQGCGWLQNQVSLLCVVCSILLCLWALHLRANQSINHPCCVLYAVPSVSLGSASENQSVSHPCCALYAVPSVSLGSASESQSSLHQNWALV